MDGEVARRVRFSLEADTPGGGRDGVRVRAASTSLMPVYRPRPAPYRDPYGDPRSRKSTGTFLKPSRTPSPNTTHAGSTPAREAPNATVVQKQPQYYAHTQGPIPTVNTPIWTSPVSDASPTGLRTLPGVSGGSGSGVGNTTGSGSGMSGLENRNRDAWWMSSGINGLGAGVVATDNVAEDIEVDSDNGETDTETRCEQTLRTVRMRALLIATFWLLVIVAALCGFSNGGANPRETCGVLAATRGDVEDLGVGGGVGVRGGGSRETWLVVVRCASASTDDLYLSTRSRYARKLRDGCTSFETCGYTTFPCRRVRAGLRAPIGGKLPLHPLTMLCTLALSIAVPALILKLQQAIEIWGLASYFPWLYWHNW